MSTDLRYVKQTGNVRVSLDLLQATLLELKFLEEVDKHPQLFFANVLRNAIRRRVVLLSLDVKQNLKIALT